MAPMDIMGRPLEVGQIVVHATRSGNSGDLTVKRVTRVENGEVYVAFFDAPPSSRGNQVWYTDRLAVVEEH